MSKPNEQDELEVDFWNEVEGVVDEEQVLEEEEVDNEEVEDELEESEEKTDDETEETTEETDDDSEESEEEISVVQSIQRQLGYEIEDQEFEDSEEGIQKLVETVSNVKADETINRYFDDYPEVKELLEYRRLGGDPDTFFQTKFPEVDYSKVELKEEDESQQERIIKQELSEIRGYSQDEIQAEIEDYRNGGILQNKAKRALSALKSKQEADRDNLVQQKRDEAKQREQEIQEHWNSVKETIDESTKIKGFKIPSKDKDPFYEYLSKPVEEGKSKAMIAHESADLETRLAIDYLLYKGFKLEDLIDRKAKQQNAQTLKDRLRKSKLDKQKNSTSESDYTQELGTI